MQTRKEGGIHYDFFWNKVKKNPHLWDSEAPHCASNIQGGFTFCVGKIAAD